MAREISYHDDPDDLYEAVLLCDQSRTLHRAEQKVEEICSSLLASAHFNVVLKALKACSSERSRASIRRALFENQQGKAGYIDVAPSPSMPATLPPEQRVSLRAADKTLISCSRSAMNSQSEFLQARARYYEASAHGVPSIVDMQNHSLRTVQFFVEYCQKGKLGVNWTDAWQQPALLDEILELAEYCMCRNLSLDALWWLSVQNYSVDYYVPTCSDRTFRGVAMETFVCEQLRSLESPRSHDDDIQANSTTVIGCQLGCEGRDFVDQRLYESSKEGQRLLASSNCRSPCELIFDEDNDLSDCNLNPEPLLELCLVVIIEGFRVNKQHLRPMQPTGLRMTGMAKLCQITWREELLLSLDGPSIQDTLTATVQWVVWQLWLNTDRRNADYSRYRSGHYDYVSDMVLCRKSIKAAYYQIIAAPHESVADLVRICSIIAGIRREHSDRDRMHGRKRVGDDGTLKPPIPNTDKESGYQTDGEDPGDFP